MTDNALYSFVWKTLAWSVTVALLVPLTWLWGMLAYKINHGAKPIDEDLREQLWWRSLLASLVLGAAAVGLAMLDFAIVDWFEFPSGPVHIFFLLGLLSFAAWMLMYYFSLEDFFAGLMMLAIYWYVPVALLWIVTLMVRNPLLDYVFTWLSEPKA